MADGSEVGLIFGKLNDEITDDEWELKSVVEIEQNVNVWQIDECLNVVAADYGKSIESVSRFLTISLILLLSLSLTLSFPLLLFVVST